MFDLDGSDGYQLTSPETSKAGGHWSERLSPAKLFLILLITSFLLRVFYASHLYEDDGLWFTAAEEILRGKALYREIYFDKPPLLPFTYALLFKLFGAHLLVIRLFTIVYVAVLCMVLYAFGSKFYGKPVGIMAAAMFTIFSTTSGSGHVNGLNTDFLMALPYTASACLLLMACSDGAVPRRRRNSRWLAFSSGGLAALSVQINPKGMFAVVFMALLLLPAPTLFGMSAKLSNNAEASPASREPLRSSICLALLACVGFVAATIPFIGYLAATGALADYWKYVWVWGNRYARFHSTAEVLLSSVRHSAGYFLLNNFLLIAPAVVVVSAARRLVRRSKNPRPLETTSQEKPLDDRVLSFDCALLMWLAVSYAGLAVGGRFYSHYFFQVLPCLSMIGSRGLIEIAAALERTSRLKRRIAIALLTAGFMVTAIRFHTRSVILGVDWIRGEKSKSSSTWYHEVLNHEERMAAAAVRDLDVASVDRIGLEAIRSGGPRYRSPEGSADYLFVWGYRPEVYFVSGLIPASRYLSAQPLTGVPADIQYVNGERTSLLDESETAAARAQLVSDLEATRPNYIIDEVGMFNAELNINNFPETAEFMKSYKSVGAQGRLMIYRRRDLKKRRKSE